MEHLKCVGETGEKVTILAARHTGIQSCAITHFALDPEREIALEGEFERLLICLSGTISVSFHDETAELEQGGFIWFPGAQVQIAAVGSAGVTLLEVAPSDKPGVGEILRGQLNRAAFSAHAGHDAQGGSFQTQTLVDQSTGANVRVFGASIESGSGMGHHIHPFDQFYFVLKGRLHFTIGMQTKIAEPGSLVIFPAGTLHSNWNEGPDPVLEITINVPHPASGEPTVRNVTFTEDRT